MKIVVRQFMRLPVERQLWLKMNIAKAVNREIELNERNLSIKLVIIYYYDMSTRQAESMTNLIS
jgi:hypothetical protein